MKKIIDKITYKTNGKNKTKDVPIAPEINFKEKYMKYL